MYQILSDILFYLQQTLFFVNDPNKRIYWGFLLSSTVCGLFFSTIYRYQYGLKNAITDLINPRALFSRATLEDIGLLIINHILRFMLFLPNLGSQIAIALFVSRFLNTHVMETPQIVLSTQVIAVAYSIFFFVVDDFTRFLLHMSMHRSRFLWRFHEWHHNSTTLTPLTVYRSHPVEALFYTTRSMLVGGLVSGIFVFLFAGRISGWDIIGINAFGFLFNALGSNLRHSHIPVSFGIFEKWFISPAQHQLHHSKYHINTNYGSCLAIWDRMFGSWLQGSPHQKLEFGLASSKTIKEYYKKHKSKK